jgi:hypothetical protein
MALVVKSFDDMHGILYDVGVVSDSSQTNDCLFISSLKVAQAASKARQSFKGKHCKVIMPT